jgi:hypothetical protein
MRLTDSGFRICSSRSSAFSISDRWASAPGLAGASFKGAGEDRVGIGEELGNSRGGSDEDDDGGGRGGGVG